MFLYPFFAPAEGACAERTEPGNALTDPSGTRWHFLNPSAGHPVHDFPIFDIVVEGPRGTMVFCLRSANSYFSDKALESFRSGGLYSLRL